MTENFTRPNKALEDAIRECNGSSEAIRDTLLRYQELNNLSTRYDRVALPERSGSIWAEPVVEKPKLDDQLISRDVTLDDGSVRTITGYSPSGLDVLEQALRK